MQFLSNKNIERESMTMVEMMLPMFKLILIMQRHHQKKLKNRKIRKKKPRKKNKSLLKPCLSCQNMIKLKHMLNGLQVQNMPNYKKKKNKKRKMMQLMQFTTKKMEKIKKQSQLRKQQKNNK